MFLIRLNMPFRAVHCNFFSLSSSCANFSSNFSKYKVLNWQADISRCNSDRKYHNFTGNHLAGEKGVNLSKLLINKGFIGVSSASMKTFVETVPSYKGIEIPEQQKLKFLNKVPVTPPGIRYRKMGKELHYIRGEEEVHTDFIHGQYGIVAQRGGMLKHGHFEMIRMRISRKLNMKKSFAIWRVDAPWKSHTKKGIGKRMGGGKGNISFYSTPVKAKRVIIEVAGKCTFEEVKPMLDIIAHNLPFPAAVMTQQMIEEERQEEERLERENINPYTFKYIIQNNMRGSHIWAKKDMDMKYFGKYA